MSLTRNNSSVIKKRQVPGGGAPAQGCGGRDPLTQKKKWQKKFLESSVKNYSSKSNRKVYFCFVFGEFCFAYVSDDSKKKFLNKNKFVDFFFRKLFLANYFFHPLRIFWTKSWVWTKSEQNSTFWKNLCPRNLKLQFC